MDWVFLSHSPSGSPLSGNDHQERVAALSGAPLTALIRQHELQFEERFAQVAEVWAMDA